MGSKPKGQPDQTSADTVDWLRRGATVDAGQVGYQDTQLCDCPECGQMVFRLRSVPDLLVDFVPPGCVRHRCHQPPAGDGKAEARERQLGIHPGEPGLPGWQPKE